MLALGRNSNPGDTLIIDCYGKYDAREQPDGQWAVFGAGEVYTTHPTAALAVAHAVGLNIEFRPREGDRCCTVARDGMRRALCDNGRFVPIWTGVIYEARARKNDGKLTWRRLRSFGSSRAYRKPSKQFVEHLKRIAEYEWMDDVKNNDLVVGQ